MNSLKRTREKFRFSSLLLARCPNCHIGKVLQSGYQIRSRCLNCKYDFHPEPGFYMGAMAVGFLIAAMTTIPPLIFLKLLNVDTRILVTFPVIEFVFVGSFLMIYCRLIWLHLEYQMTHRLDTPESKSQERL